MAQIPFRANVQSSVFPMLSDLSAQTIVMPGQDQTYVPGVNPSEQVTPVDRGIAQLFYGHNIMPSTYGFQSVGYRNKQAGISGVYFQDIQLVRSTDKLDVYVALDYQVSKTLWVWSASGWLAISGAPTGLTSRNLITTATVNGITYINVAFIGTYTYNVASNVMTKVTLNGLEDPLIAGIVATSGYLIALAIDGYSWSSTSDPLDFVPDLKSGAGGGKLQEAKGDIVFAQQTAYGFIIYTTANAISVTYSGNAQFPFNAREIPSAGGIASPWMVTKEASGQQYAYTTNGLQTVYHTQATTKLPYITDFLAGKKFEDYDIVNKVFLQSEISGVMRKRVALVSDRYLVLSYGISNEAEFTHALVVDVTQTRTGKLKIRHNACFQLQNLAPEVVETPRESLAFLAANGEINVVDFSQQVLPTDAVAVFGKYQFVRQNNLCLQEVQIENVTATDDVIVEIAPTWDGKTFLPHVPGYPAPDTVGKETRSFLFDTECRNFSVFLTGRFDLVGMELYFFPTSRRR